MGFWLELLRARFRGEPFTVEQARAALGSFVPRGTLQSLRQEGHVRVLDTGHMILTESAPLDDSRLRDLHDSLLSRTRQLLDDSKERVEHLRQLLRETETNVLSQGGAELGTAWHPFHTGPPASYEAPEPVRARPSSQ